MRKLLIPLLAVFALPNSVKPSYADLGVNITSSSTWADKSVYLTGKCSNRGSTDIYLTSSSTWADMTICITGNI